VSSWLLSQSIGKDMTNKGLSDSNLLKLRRQAVHKHFNDCCFFCGQHKSVSPLEDHHIVKRKALLLRYDWRNSILVCKYVCHNYAETPAGKHKIDLYLTQSGFREYLQARTGCCKDWFVSHGITRKDFLSQIYEDLKVKLNEPVF
jgi:transcription elongation factor Elf1